MSFPTLPSSSFLIPPSSSLPISTSSYPTTTSLLSPHSSLSPSSLSSSSSFPCECLSHHVSSTSLSSSPTPLPSSVSSVLYSLSEYINTNPRHHNASSTSSPPLLSLISSSFIPLLSSPSVPLIQYILTPPFQRVLFTLFSSHFSLWGDEEKRAMLYAMDMVGRRMKGEGGEYRGNNQNDNNNNNNNNTPTIDHHTLCLSCFSNHLITHLLFLLSSLIPPSSLLTPNTFLLILPIINTINHLIPNLFTLHPHPSLFTAPTPSSSTILYDSNTNANLTMVSEKYDRERRVRTFQMYIGNILSKHGEKFDLIQKNTIEMVQNVGKERDNHDDSQSSSGSYKVLYLSIMKMITNYTNHYTEFCSTLPSILKDKDHTQNRHHDNDHNTSTHTLASKNIIKPQGKMTDAMIDTMMHTVSPTLSLLSALLHSLSSPCPTHTEYLYRIQVLHHFIQIKCQNNDQNEHLIHFPTLFSCIHWDQIVHFIYKISPNNDDDRKMAGTIMRVVSSIIMMGTRRTKDEGEYSKMISLLHNNVHPPIPSHFIISSSSPPSPSSIMQNLLHLSLHDKFLNEISFRNNILRKRTHRGMGMNNAYLSYVDNRNVIHIGDIQCMVNDPHCHYELGMLLSIYSSVSSSSYTLNDNNNIDLMTPILRYLSLMTQRYQDEVMMYFGHVFDTSPLLYQQYDMVLSIIMKIGKVGDYGKGGKDIQKYYMSIITSLHNILLTIPTQSHTEIASLLTKTILSYQTILSLLSFSLSSSPSSPRDTHDITSITSSFYELSFDRFHRFIRSPHPEIRRVSLSLCQHYMKFLYHLSSYHHHSTTPTTAPDFSLYELLKHFCLEKVSEYCLDEILFGRPEKEIWNVMGTGMTMAMTQGKTMVTQYHHDGDSDSDETLVERMKMTQKILEKKYEEEKMNSENDAENINILDMLPLKSISPSRPSAVSSHTPNPQITNSVFSLLHLPRLIPLFPSSPATSPPFLSVLLHMYKVREWEKMGEIFNIILLMGGSEYHKGDNVYCHEDMIANLTHLILTHFDLHDTLEITLSVLSSPSIASNIPVSLPSTLSFLRSTLLILIESLTLSVFPITSLPTIITEFINEMIPKILSLSPMGKDKEMVVSVLHTITKMIDIGYQKGMGNHTNSDSKRDLTSLPNSSIVFLSSDWMTKCLKLQNDHSALISLFTMIRSVSQYDIQIQRNCNCEGKKILKSKEESINMMRIVEGMSRMMIEKYNNESNNHIAHDTSSLYLSYFHMISSLSLLYPFLSITLFVPSSPSSSSTAHPSSSLSLSLLRTFIDNTLSALANKGSKNNVNHSTAVALLHRLLSPIGEMIQSIWNPHVISDNEKNSNTAKGEEVNDGKEKKKGKDVIRHAHILSYRLGEITKAMKLYEMMESLSKVIEKDIIQTFHQSSSPLSILSSLLSVLSLIHPILSSQSPVESPTPSAVPSNTQSHRWSKQSHTLCKLSSTILIKEYNDQSTPSPSSVTPHGHKVEKNKELSSFRTPFSTTIKQMGNIKVTVPTTTTPIGSEKVKGGLIKLKEKMEKSIGKEKETPTAPSTPLPLRDITNKKTNTATFTATGNGMKANAKTATADITKINKLSPSTLYPSPSSFPSDSEISHLRDTYSMLVTKDFWFLSNCAEKEMRGAKSAMEGEMRRKLQKVHKI